MNTDILLISISIILLFGGLIGGFMPILPGPPFSFLGFFLLHFSTQVSFTSQQLWTFGLLSLCITIIDYFLPVWGTRNVKGSKYATFGALIGLLIGVLFFLPYGVIIGPFLGAWLAGKINGMSDKNAMRVALGSFAGIILGMAMKIILSMAMLILSIKALLTTSP